MAWRRDDKFCFLSFVDHNFLPSGGAEVLFLEQNRLLAIGIL
jgi:hypothetical protein